VASEVTVTRKTLRRDIGKSARMRFYLRYPDGEAAFTPSGDSNAFAASTEVFYCTNLTQKEGFWKNAYIYVQSTDSNRDGFERLIPNFNREKNALYLEWPCTTDEVPTTDDEFELLDIWPPHQIHDLANDAIRDSWRAYPDIVIDESFTICRRRRQYLLSTDYLEKQPAMVLQIYAETVVTGQRGSISSYDGVSGSDHLVTVSGDLSNVDSNWRFSYYYGPAGDHPLNNFAVVSADTATGQIQLAGLINGSDSPTTDTWFRLWDPTEQRTDWYPMYQVGGLDVEFPPWFEMQGEPSASWGLRYRIVYAAVPDTLSADSDATTIPQYFIKNKTLAFMHDALVGDNRADRRDHTAIAEHYDQLARDYAMRNPRRLPNGSVWYEGSFYSGYGTEQNPLGWPSL